MAEDGSQDAPKRIPHFIQRQLNNPPLLPGESVRDFNTLFRELEYSAEGGAETAADYAIVYQATVLIWILQRLEHMRAAIIRHFGPAAVAALFRRTSEYGEAEPGSLAYRKAAAEAENYFASEHAKKQAQERFAKAGFAADAVEVEAFQQALSQLAIIDRQIAVAQRQLLSFLKEIDRRNSRRAEEFREVANNTVSRARVSGSESGAKS
jgi:hypothetical protein